MRLRDRAQGRSRGFERGLHSEPGDQRGVAWGEFPRCLAPAEAGGGLASSKALLVRQQAGGPGAGRGCSYLPRYFIHFAPTDPLFISVGMQPWWKLGPRKGLELEPPP